MPGMRTTITAANGCEVTLKVYATIHGWAWRLTATDDADGTVYLDRRSARAFTHLLAAYHDALAFGETL